MVFLLLLYLLLSLQFLKQPPKTNYSNEMVLASKLTVAMLTQVPRLGQTDGLAPHTMFFGLNFCCCHVLLGKSLVVYIQAAASTFNGFPQGISTCCLDKGCRVIALLKSVRVHFAPGSNGRSFPLEYS